MKMLMALIAGLSVSSMASAELSSSLRGEGAKTLTCSDDRDDALQLIIDTVRGTVAFYASGQLIETVKGDFENCAVVDESQGAIGEQTICDFTESGAERSAGSVTRQEDGGGFYSLDLLDQKFRGSCH